MKHKYRCWLADSQEEDEALEVEEFDAPDAAEASCDRLLENGFWSGDPIPRLMDVHVRCSDGTLVVVSVETEWSVSFYSHGQRNVANYQSKEVAS